MDITLDSLSSSRVHLLGIGGIGVSALARLLKQKGVPVTGCDVRPSSITHALNKEGIECCIGHDPAHVADSDVIVYSSAIPDTNPELLFARQSGAHVLHRSHLLALLLRRAESVGITGTNGKGTVASMLTWILETAGMSPSFYVGGICPNLGTNARLGTGPHFVAELDESDGSLLNVAPSHALLNNLELDHLNYYDSFDHAVEVLTAFFASLPTGAACFVNDDDSGARTVAGRLAGRRLVRFGQGVDADYRCVPSVVTDEGSRFSVWTDGQTRCLGEFDLNVPGAYNMENALAAVAVAAEFGVPAEAIREALASFRGLANRYGLISGGGVKIVKDYMSHPMGIRRVLETARLGNPRRLIAVFKPYRYTMIRYHAENYADAFSLADETMVTEMWEAGEDPIPGVDTRWLASKIGERAPAVGYVERMEPIAHRLLETGRPGDCIVFFGGDDLFEIADELCREFARRS